MPIYDYRCDHCGHVFSSVQSFKDEPLAACPNCGKRPRRLITTPAIVFKGSGWYKTDSRPSSSAAKDGAKDAAAAEGGGSKDATKDKSTTPAKTDKAPTSTGGG
jgi:putative FmdB family regulatory protein